MRKKKTGKPIIHIRTKMYDELLSGIQANITSIYKTWNQTLPLLDTLIKAPDVWLFVLGNAAPGYEEMQKRHTKPDGTVDIMAFMNEILGVQPTIGIELVYNLVTFIKDYLGLETLEQVKKAQEPERAPKPQMPWEPKEP